MCPNTPRIWVLKNQPISRSRWGKEASGALAARSGRFKRKARSCAARRTLAAAQPTPTRGREVCGQQDPEGKGQTWPQRQHPLPNCKSSWDPGWLTSARRVSARDQLTRGDIWHTWGSGTPAVHPGNCRLGPGK